MLKTEFAQPLDLNVTFLINCSTPRHEKNETTALQKLQEKAAEKDPKRSGNRTAQKGGFLPAQLAHMELNTSLKFTSVGCWAPISSEGRGISQAVICISAIIQQHWCFQLLLSADPTEATAAPRNPGGTRGFPFHMNLRVGDLQLHSNVNQQNKVRGARSVAFRPRQDCRLLPLGLPASL